MKQITEMLKHAARVAEFASKFDESHAAYIVTMTDEPELLLEPGEAPPRYHTAAIDAARLICFDASAEYRSGKPEHAQ